MITATQKDFDTAKNEIVKTPQDSIGDKIARTKRLLKEKGFTHYLIFGRPIEL